MKRVLTVLILLLGVAGIAFASHSATLTWTLSVDDDAALATPVNCVASANCLQNVYRAQGACSATSNFTLLTNTQR